jgi:hypothetical protein
MNDTETRWKWFLSGAIAGISTAVAFLFLRPKRSAPLEDRNHAQESTPSTEASPSEAEKDQSNIYPIATIVAVVGAAVSVTLAIEITRRFVAPGPDRFVICVTFLQALLTASSLAVLTGSGQQLINVFLVHRGAKQWFTKRHSALFSLIVASIFVTIWLQLPSIARRYNEQGTKLIAEGRFSEARQQLRYAESLAPDLAEIHYNLGYVSEELLDFEQAIKEYRLALDKDGSLADAYNNFARLYIVQGKDIDGAIRILRQGLQLIENDRKRPILFKNLGWAHLKKGLYNEALKELQVALDLQKALPLDNRQSCLTFVEIYRLLALVYEELDQIKDARREWQNSLGFATGPCGDALDAIEWAAEAQDHLSALEGK